METLEIFSLCVNNSIRLEPEWIPRERNEFADYYSRIVDHDDYMFNSSVFASFGVHMVLTDLPAQIMPTLIDLILDSELLDQKLWTHLRVTGVPITTGCSLLPKSQGCTSSSC